MLPELQCQTSKPERRGNWTGQLLSGLRCSPQGLQFLPRLSREGGWVPGCQFSGLNPYCRGFPLSISHSRGNGTQLETHGQQAWVMTPRMNGWMATHGQGSFWGHRWAGCSPGIKVHAGSWVWVLQSWLFRETSHHITFGDDADEGAGGERWG